MRPLILRQGASPDRQALVAAATRTGLSLRQLSAKLGRAETYLTQFVQRNSPKILPPFERRELAKLLGIPEADLMAPGARTLPDGELLPTAAPARSGALPRGSKALAAQVEHRREGGGESDPFPLAETLDGVTDKAVAITLTRQHGLLLQPRSVLICEPADSAKLGDLVALIAGGELESVGVLIPASGGGQAVLEGSDTPRPVGDGQLWRIRAIRAA